MLTDDQAIRFRKLAYAMLRDRALPRDVDRGDLVAEALLRAHSQVDHDPAKSNFPTWVRMHVGSAVANYLTARNRQKRDPSRVVSLDLMEERAASVDDHATEVDKAIVIRWRSVMATINAKGDSSRVASTLPLPQRQEEILRARGKFRTEAETADYLCLSPHTVRGQLQRAYIHLGVRTLDDALAALDA